MKIPICATLATLLLTLSNTHAQLLHEWTCNVERLDARAVQTLRGETLTLRANLRQYGSPVALPDTATATYYYQTNGMKNLWWSLPATLDTATSAVSTTWTPQADAGADRYVFFFAISDATNLIYRAYGTLSILYSPGAEPNSLPLPTNVLDFASITYANAPWLTAEEDPLFTNWHDNELQDDIQTEIITIADESAYLSISNRVLSIYNATNALVYTSSENSTLEAIIDTLEQRLATLEQRLATLDSAKNWASYDALGATNSISDTVLLNRPYTQLASGFTWASSGGLFCLTTSGAVAFVGDDGGEMRLSIDAERYIAIKQGGTVTVGAQPTGFKVEGTTAQITYPYSTGDFPVIWYNSNLITGTWTQWDQTQIIWATDPDTQTATATLNIEALGNLAYFAATTTASLRAYFYSSMPAYLPAGIMTNQEDVEPIIIDSAIIYTDSDGTTYRLPAQLQQ